MQTAAKKAANERLLIEEYPNKQISGWNVGEEMFHVKHSKNTVNLLLYEKKVFGMLEKLQFMVEKRKFGGYQS